MSDEAKLEWEAITAQVRIVLRKLEAGQVRGIAMVALEDGPDDLDGKHRSGPLRFVVLAPELRDRAALESYMRKLTTALSATYGLGDKRPEVRPVDP